MAGPPFSRNPRFTPLKYQGMFPRSILKPLRNLLRRIFLSHHILLDVRRLSGAYAGQFMEDIPSDI